MLPLIQAKCQVKKRRDEREVERQLLEQQRLEHDKARRSMLQSDRCAAAFVSLPSVGHVIPWLGFRSFMMRSTASGSPRKRSSIWTMRRLGSPCKSEPVVDGFDQILATRH